MFDQLPRCLLQVLLNYFYQKRRKNQNRRIKNRTQQGAVDCEPLSLMSAYIAAQEEFKVHQLTFHLDLPGSVEVPVQRVPQPVLAVPVVHVGRNHGH